ncbi:hypothetical protein [Kaistia sp. MMO-174]|uniref:hypothetical protein n=1 Tax=Kaistia sp. MMO-174 TaxID=3081256 RepID=UPI00301A3D31
MDWLITIGIIAILIGLLIFAITFRRFCRSPDLDRCFAIAMAGGIAGGAFVGLGLLFIVVRALFYFWIGG